MGLETSIAGLNKCVAIAFERRFSVRLWAIGLFAYALAIAPIIGSYASVVVAECSTAVLVTATFLEHCFRESSTKAFLSGYGIAFGGFAISAFSLGVMDASPANVEGVWAVSLVAITFAPTLTLALLATARALHRTNRAVVRSGLRTAKIGPAALLLGIPIVTLQFRDETGELFGIPHNLLSDSGQGVIVGAIIAIWGTQATVVSVRALKEKRRMARDLRAMFGGASLVAVVGIFAALPPGRGTLGDIVATSALFSLMLTFGISATATKLTRKNGSLATRFA